MQSFHCARHMIGPLLMATIAVHLSCTRDVVPTVPTIEKPSAGRSAPGPAGRSDGRASSDATAPADPFECAGVALLVARPRILETTLLTLMGTAKASTAMASLTAGKTVCDGNGTRSQFDDAMADARGVIYSLATGWHRATVEAAVAYNAKISLADCPLGADPTRRAAPGASRSPERTPAGAPGGRRVPDARPGAPAAPRADERPTLAARATSTLLSHAEALSGSRCPSGATGLGQLSTGGFAGGMRACLDGFIESARPEVPPCGGMTQDGGEIWSAFKAVYETAKTWNSIVGVATDPLSVVGSSPATAAIDGIVLVLDSFATNEARRQAGSDYLSGLPPQNDDPAYLAEYEERKSLCEASPQCAEDRATKVAERRVQQEDAAKEKGKTLKVDDDGTVSECDDQGTCTCIEGCPTAQSDGGTRSLCPTMSNGDIMTTFAFGRAGGRLGRLGSATDVLKRCQCEAKAGALRRVTRYAALDVCLSEEDERRLDCARDVVDGGDWEPPPGGVCMGLLEADKVSLRTTRRHCLAMMCPAGQVGARSKITGLCTCARVDVLSPPCNCPSTVCTDEGQYLTCDPQSPGVCVCESVTSWTPPVEAPPTGGGGPPTPPNGPPGP